MITAAIIVGIILIGLLLLMGVMSSSRHANFNIGVFLGVWIGTFCIMELFTINDIIRKQKPTAIDVYRDKTELQITSVNGIPTDTVVVFKK